MLSQDQGESDEEVDDTMSQSSANSEEMCPTPPTSTSTPRGLVGRTRGSQEPV
jgi:hypothetical protein